MTNQLSLFPQLEQRSDEQRSAVFSSCRKYRYSLSMIWDASKPLMMLIGLNPSTADEENDDPTVRRCKRFAREWGYGGLIMMNGFGFRDTNPKGMKAAADPNGPGNDDELRRQAERAAFVVAAWGNHCPDDRERRVCEIVASAGKSIYCLDRNSTGKPKHPLYIKASKKPELFYDFRNP